MTQATQRRPKPPRDHHVVLPKSNMGSRGSLHLGYLHGAGRQIGGGEAEGTVGGHSGRHSYPRDSIPSGLVIDRGLGWLAMTQWKDEKKTNKCLVIMTIIPL